MPSFRAEETPSHAEDSSHRVCPAQRPEPGMAPAPVRRLRAKLARLVALMHAPEPEPPLSARREDPFRK